MRPASITSNGGAITVPPAPGTCDAVASTSVTVTYEFQCGGTPAAACSPRPEIAAGVAALQLRHRIDVAVVVDRDVVERPAEQRAVERLRRGLVGGLQIDPARGAGCVFGAFGHGLLLCSKGGSRGSYRCVRERLTTVQSKVWLPRARTRLGAAGRGTDSPENARLRGLRRRNVEPGDPDTIARPTRASMPEPTQCASRRAVLASLCSRTR